jgi:hypothetical protein
VSPVELVVIVRDNDLGSAGARRPGRGARAPVMDDGGHPGEQFFVIDVADRQAVVTRVARREARPALRKDRAQP